MYVSVFVSQGGLIASHVSIQRQDIVQGLILSAAPSRNVGGIASGVVVRIIDRERQSLTVEVITAC